MRSKKAVYNIFFNLILEVIVIIYGFIVPKIIISNFGSNVNGLISSITQFLGYITLLESGIGPVVRAALYKPIVDKDKKMIASILKKTEKFFRILAGIFIVYLIGLAFIYPIINNGDFNYWYTFSLVLIISISSFAEYYFGMTYKVFLQADQCSYVISILQILTYLLSTVVIVLLAKFNCSIHIIKLVSGLIFVIRPLLQNFYVKRKYAINLDEADPNYELKNKWDGLAQHIAWVIHTKTDVTVLTIFSTLIEVSVYSVYYLVVKGIKALITAFSNGMEGLFGNILANGEKDNLNNRFNMYEVLFFTISTIIYACTMILIAPFVKVYTINIHDADYYRVVFGYLIVISEFIWAIRLPYDILIKVAGHFKETRKWAIVETIVNVLLSVILVIKYGIIGVTIGTIVAMTTRTIEMLWHANKHILKRNVLKSVTKIILLIIECVVVVFISVNYLPFLDNVSYLNWLVNALMVFGVALIVILLVNVIIFKKEFKELFNIIKGMLKRKKK